MEPKIQESNEKLVLSLKNINQELKENREKLIDYIHKNFLEINKGEIIIAAGAFTLIVNFLLKDTSKESFNDINYLKSAVIILAGTLILKFLISRLSTDLAMKEMEMLDNRMNKYGEAFKAILKFSKSQNKQDLDKCGENIKEAEKIDTDYRESYKPFIRKYGFYLNWLEYTLLTSGIVLLVIFFIKNV